MPATNKTKEIVFDFFTYHILPIEQRQTNLFEEIVSIEELKDRKNSLFESALLDRSNKFSSTTGDELDHDIQKEGEVFLLKLGKKKDILLTLPEFKEKHIDVLPFVYIIIDNNVNAQRIAISRNTEAFSSSFVVAHILQEGFTMWCKKLNLQVIVNPVLDRQKFWDLILRYKDRITQIKFNLIKPNLANISSGFKDEIRDLIDSTNSITTKVELNAPKGSHLINITPDNDRINSLVEYSTAGGGESISIRAKGVKHVIKTESTISKKSIEDIEIKGESNAAIEAFKKIIE